MTVWLLIPTVCYHMGSNSLPSGDSFESTSCRIALASQIYATEAICKAHSTSQVGMTDVVGQVTHTTFECVEHEVQKS